MKKKLIACFLAAAVVFGGVTALGAASGKIGSASKETGNSKVQLVEVENDGMSVKVTYSGVKESQYVVMAVTESGIDTASGVPTKDSINNNQNNEIVYMDQAEAGADGTVTFDVYPNLDHANIGDTIGIYISGTGDEMTKVGEFTLGGGIISYGDVNGDGEVTSADRILLARYIARLPGWYGESAAQNNRVILIENADLNGDGEVTAADRILLARHVAKLPGYETLPIVRN